MQIDDDGNDDSGQGSQDTDTDSEEDGECYELVWHEI